MLDAKSLRNLLVALIYPRSQKENLAELQEFLSNSDLDPEISAELLAAFLSAAKARSEKGRADRKKRSGTKYYKSPGYCPLYNDGHCQACGSEIKAGTEAFCYQARIKADCFVACKVQCVPLQWQKHCAALQDRVRQSQAQKAEKQAKDKALSKDLNDTISRYFSEKLN